MGGGPSDRFCAQCRYGFQGRILGLDVGDKGLGEEELATVVVDGPATRQHPDALPILAIELALAPLDGSPATKGQEHRVSLLGANVELPSDIGHVRHQLLELTDQPVLGLTQIHAEATSLLAVIPTAIVGAWRQGTYGNVRWRAALVLGIAAIGGVEGGVQIAETLPQHALRRLFAVLVLLVAAQIAWRAWRRPAYPSQ